MTIAPTARFLLLSFALAACAADGDDIIDVEISASDPNGKADAIDGKQIRLRMRDHSLGWIVRDGVTTDLTHPNKVDIHAATAETVVATGGSYVFRGTDEAHLLQDSPWGYGRLLSLSVDKLSEGEHRLGFLLVDVHDSFAPLSCERGDLRLNYFENVVINLNDRELYANEAHTFTFAECGIDEAYRHNYGPDKDVAQWTFDAFVLPLATTGRLQGTYNYDLKVELL
jgi:hypothetical protein